MEQFTLGRKRKTAGAIVDRLERRYEVATSALYLCSDLAKFVTGVILPVSGGGEVGYKVKG